MTADEVVREVCARAWRLGIAVYISPDATIECEGEQVGGYFEQEPRPYVAVASGIETELWLGILLHEFSHACQWVEQAPVWLATGDDSPVWNWLQGKPVRGIKAEIAKVQAMEADCERRTVRLIKEMGAPINLERYCKGANAYLHFHNTLAATRKWYAKGKGPYRVPEVVALCNPTLDRDFSKTPPKLAKALLGCV